ncbi:MAG: hypothetical protein AAB791_03195 [Patescibacteria group bacterium]
MILQSLAAALPAGVAGNVNGAVEKIQIVEIPKNVSPELMSQIVESIQNGKLPVQAIADLINSNASAGVSFWDIMGVVVLIVLFFLFLAMFLVGLVMVVLNMFNLYHWGLASKESFEKAGESKGKWFNFLVTLPVITFFTFFIPIAGWVAAPLLFIFWTVMVLVYFFSVRKKVVTGKS